MATLSASVRSAFAHQPAPASSQQRIAHTPTQPQRPYIPQQQQPPQIKLTPRPASGSSTPAVPSGAAGVSSSGAGSGEAGSVGSEASQQSSTAHRPAQGSTFVEAVLAGDEDAIEKLALAAKLSIKLAAGGSSQAGSAAVARPRCGQCSLSPSRALLCTDCGSTFCHNHARSHSESTQHPTFFDLRASAVYDALAQDYIHHPALERVIDGERKGKRTARNSDPESSSTAAKRRKVAVSRASSPGRGEPVIPRGLRNLGQTCYMSVILQAFVHNPHLRAFFLGDRHNRALCDRAGTCFGCEIDRVFSEVYTSGRGPFAPTRFLYAMWHSSSELSGYAQQDAQEFFISTLNLLHSATCPPSHKHGHDGTCACVAHATFGGLLKSEVECGHCGNLSTSTDPFLDLSLDLRARAGVAEQGGATSLERCLERFTAPEGTEYSCARCGMQGRQSKASKRLRIERLPKVLAVQLKRFEHTNKSSKIEDECAFPLQLDPSPFLADEPATTTASTKPAIEVRYRLHTVVVHIGTLSTGHYVAYVLAPPQADGRERRWFHTSDDDVRECSQQEVERAKAYMLFYEQQ